LNEDSNYTFGAYIGADTYGIGLVNNGGKIIEKHELLIGADTNPQTIMDFFSTKIEELVAKRDIPQDRILGVGAAVMGPMSKKKGIVLRRFYSTGPQQQEGSPWDYVHVKDMLEFTTGYRVWVDNLAETALLEEIRYGKYRNVENAIYLYLDLGCGFAVVAGRLLGSGEDDSSSAVDHMVIDINGEQCRCGKFGCLSTYDSDSTIMRSFEELGIEVSNLPEVPTDQIWTTSPVVELIKKYLDDSRMEAYFDKLTKAYAAAFANIIYVTRPQVVFLGGRKAIQLERLFDRVIELVEKQNSLFFVTGIKYVKSDFSAEMLIRGSAFLPINHYVGIYDAGIA
jgi:predicted NBD/HSP70 family sugar kinase